MATSHHKKIRLVLRGSEDGMPVKKLAETLGLDADVVRISLKAMPDTYIDRWVIEDRKPAAVWCAVQVPEDCPPPRKGRNP